MLKLIVPRSDALRRYLQQWKWRFALLPVGVEYSSMDDWDSISWVWLQWYQKRHVGNSCEMFERRVSKSAAFPYQGVSFVLTGIARLYPVSHADVN